MFSYQTPINIEQQQKQLKGQLDSLYNQIQRPRQSAVRKNILLIGRTRSGKSTLKQMLTDPREVSSELTLFAQTREPRMDIVKIHHSDLTLNLIDTPGLFDRQYDSNGLLTNDECLRQIRKYCIDIHVTEFHLVCLCLSMHSGINAEDIQATRQFIEYFGPRLADHLCMIITRCESKNEGQRLLLHNEIEHDQDFGPITKQFKKGIHFSGAVNLDDWNQANNAVLLQFNTICEYRNILLNLIEQSTSSFKIEPLLITPPLSPVPSNEHSTRKKG
ncbi:unnamed protein product [Adineta steineri]|uniref:AIG1-type G domain-containing protein n=1 Tax=Adineta steineri TaxID=433720 RepID=A0A815PDQ1_9BILA|nr:unnamed protein product [Adineta steineri]CAF1447521.1 unnamed protein product [Adineta steineri]CAF1517299.1 unnamed protein product [Adineta steineri]CAF1517337.1 unnamed protein product [Adineta steineri]CAF1649069.1 unnamed protein product [Adineta steineri]